MARMIELIRQSAVPANLMRSAARGALALPAAEMIEILVYLAGHPVFGEQARMTLAGWDEQSAVAVAADPTSPPEVLKYFAAPQNLRPALISALLDNSAVPEETLVEWASSNSRELLARMVENPRARKSSNVLYALSANPLLTDAELARTTAALAALGEEAPETAAAEEQEDPEFVALLEAYQRDHAHEIAAEEGKPFTMTSASDVLGIEDAVPPAPNAGVGELAVSAGSGTGAKPAKGEESERESTIQKISKLRVGERVQLAMKGTKDERFVLIRDGAKVVSLAVLESPKLSDAEVETFAAMKNVQEDVLRGIARKRKFMKNYGVVRSLVNNPRAPLDLSLSLVPHLLANDLKGLSMNKNVADTIRKVALKMFREKTSGKKGE
ncbi:MAG TPA: hypothetical protein VFA60_08055 [Terriglobales bacterium]|nr:hypothetical protein [Terriglobales bacterium]